MAGIGDFFGGLAQGGMELLGGYLSNQYNKKQSEVAFQRQFDAQNFFNTHALQQRMDDARAAGISPQFAISGASAATAPSMQVFGDSIGPALGRMGQDISGAVKRGMSSEDRGTAEEMERLTLERARLQNKLLGVQIARAEAPAAGADAVETNPSGVTPAERQTEGLRVGINRVRRMDPNRSSQQDAENEYGDSADWFEGVPNRMADYRYNIRHPDPTAAIYHGAVAKLIAKAYQRGDYPLVRELQIRMLRNLRGYD